MCLGVEIMVIKEKKIYDSPHFPKISVTKSLCLESEEYALFISFHTPIQGFPDGSAGKESTCNAGDTGDADLIPGLGRSSGGGKW